MVVNGTCVINCSQSTVSSCEVCATLTACTDCLTGFTLVLDGTFCSPTCTDSNCMICSVGGTCEACKVGYALVNGACNKIIC